MQKHNQPLSPLGGTPPREGLIGGEITWVNGEIPPRKWIVERLILPGDLPTTKCDGRAAAIQVFWCQGRKITIHDDNIRQISGF